MITTESSQANEWNHLHTHVAHPLSEYGDWTNGVTAHPLLPISHRNGQGQMQDRPTRLRMEKAAKITRKGW